LLFPLTTSDAIVDVVGGVEEKYSDIFPEIQKISDRSELREVEPAGSDIQLGFKAFRWNYTKNDDGSVAFESRRGQQFYAKIFVSELEFEVSDSRSGLILFAEEYLESNTAIEDMERHGGGLRKIQNRDAISFRYSGSTQGLKAYWYTTAVLNAGQLLTFHTWSGKPDWDLHEGITKEFLSAIRF